MLSQGQKAPDFSLPDQNSKLHSLADYSGSWVVLYFYPKDDTPGCTIEACSFRDSYEIFTKENIVILGVSKDSEASHTRFAEKFNIPFTLLSDTATHMIQEYGAWGKSSFMGRIYDGVQRVTYLIDPEGVIAQVYPKVKPKEHVEQILADIKNIKKKD